MKEYNFKINGNSYKVAVNNIENGVASVSVNGTDYKVEMEDYTTKPAAPKPVKPAVAPATYQAAPQAKPAAPKPSGTEVKSPLPGTILELKVNEGDQVKEGQVVMVLEAMKMENNIDANRSGVVKKIAKRPGDSVMEGEVLLIIE